VRIVVQRVSKAAVSVHGAVVGAIGHGVCLLVGVAADDSPEDALAAADKIAEPLVESLADALEERGVPTARGRFGAMMEVELTNDGPVTLVLEVSRGRVS
jgi:D-Tyr-tRNAtyr deacylase